MKRKVSDKLSSTEIDTYLLTLAHLKQQMAEDNKEYDRLEKLVDPKGVVDRFGLSKTEATKAYVVGDWSFERTVRNSSPKLDEMAATALILDKYPKLEDELLEWTPHIIPEKLAEAVKAKKVKDKDFQACIVEPEPTIAFSIKPSKTIEGMDGS